MRVWIKLDHPNILKFMGYVVEENGFPALISEWMGNGTVLDYVKKHPDTDVFSLVSLLKTRLCYTPFIEKLRGISQGLEYLHKQGIVHSDIKSVGTEVMFALCYILNGFATGQCPRVKHRHTTYLRLRSIMHN